MGWNLPHSSFEKSLVIRDASRLVSTNYSTNGFIIIEKYYHTYELHGRLQYGVESTCVAAKIHTWLMLHLTK